MLTKCAKCNTFQVISDFVYDFMKFNTLNLILKIDKKIIKKDPDLLRMDIGLYVYIIIKSRKYISS